MATEYTITYTFTAQDNTSGTRSVAFDRFTASGDTNRAIGQITSIQYVHYHSSKGSMNWNLRGRLVLMDGTTFTSGYQNIHIDGTVVKYVNTFTELPTAAQFSTLATVQTLDTQGKAASGGYSSTLYWRATSACPMQLIVTFIEEPPVSYAPKIDFFQLIRCNAGGAADDEGQYIAASLKLSIADSAGLDGAQCRIYYAANAYPEVGASQYVDLSGRISTLLSGVGLNTSILTGVWSLGSVWNFAVVFTSGDETAIATASIARGSTSLHISNESGGGAAIGGFSTGTGANPKFEAYVPAHFYGGIAGLTNYTAGETETLYTWIDGRRIYRRVITVSVGAGTIVDIFTFPSAIEMINISGYLIRAGGVYRFPPCWYAGGGNYHIVWMETATRLVTQSTAALTGQLIIDYVK